MQANKKLCGAATKSGPLGQEGVFAGYALRGYSELKAQQKEMKFVTRDRKSVV